MKTGEAKTNRSPSGLLSAALRALYLLNLGRLTNLVIHPRVAAQGNGGCAQQNHRYAKA
jgi:hypothetical protein